MICVDPEKILLPAVTLFYPDSYAAFTFSGAVDSRLALYAFPEPPDQEIR